MSEPAPAEANERDPAAACTPVDLLVAGLGPGGCAAALAARAQGLSVLAPPAATGAACELAWHTAVTGLDLGATQVRVSRQDGAGGAPRQVLARHVIDASGGRLEALGRPARQRAGLSHLVMTAEYHGPPWFEGSVGARDPRTQELCLLFPTWGRRGVIAYLDAAPGRPMDSEAFVRRLQTLAEHLGMGLPSQPPWAVEVFQRALPRPTNDRVLAIGDAVGTVDMLLGAGLSTAIEDGAQAGHSVAAAQCAATADAEAALLRQASASIHARHRSSLRRGRLMLGLRPLWARAWPAAALAEITRASVGPPSLLRPAVRFVFGRRPQAT